MGEALQHVPVRLIEHGQLGIVGAARWYLNKKATKETMPQTSATRTKQTGVKPHQHTIQGR